MSSISPLYPCIKTSIKGIRVSGSFPDLAQVTTTFPGSEGSTTHHGLGGDNSPVARRDDKKGALRQNHFILGQ